MFENTMTTSLLLVLGVTLALTSFIGCSEEEARDGANKVKDTSVMVGKKVGEKTLEQRDNLAAKLEMEVIDYLVCSGLAKPSTVDAVKVALADRDKVGLQELLMAPENTARLVGTLGLTVEGLVLMIQNIDLIMEQKATLALLEGDTMSGALECRMNTPVACSQGVATAEVECDSQDRVTQVRQSYEACTLRGREHQGSVLYIPASSPVNPTSSPRLGFEDFSLDETTTVKGNISIGANATKSQQRLSLDAGDEEGLKYLSYGGHQGKFSCGQTLTLNTFDVTRNASLFSIDFDGKKQTKSSTYAVKTLPNKGLKWTASKGCACPDAGSGIAVSVPKPLGRADATATLQVSFIPGDGECARAQVELVDWPMDCSVTESVQGDCGKAAAQRLLQPLVGALCKS